MMTTTTKTPEFELQFIAHHSVYKCSGYVVHVVDGPTWLIFRETKELALADAAEYWARTRNPDGSLR